MLLHIYKLSVNLCDEHLGLLVMLSPAGVEMLVCEMFCVLCLYLTTHTHQKSVPPKSSKSMLPNTQQITDVALADSTICVLIEFVSLQRTVDDHR